GLTLWPYAPVLSVARPVVCVCGSTGPEPQRRRVARTGPGRIGPRLRRPTLIVDRLDVGRRPPLSLRVRVGRPGAQRYRVAGTGSGWIGPRIERPVPAPTGLAFASPNSRPPRPLHRVSM